jgi:hypothetical protein
MTDKRPQALRAHVCLLVMARPGGWHFCHFKAQVATANLIVPCARPLAPAFPRPPHGIACGASGLAVITACTGTPRPKSGGDRLRRAIITSRGLLVAVIVCMVSWLSAAPSVTSAALSPIPYGSVVAIRAAVPTSAAPAGLLVRHCDFELYSFDGGDTGSGDFQWGPYYGAWFPL